MKLLIIAAHPTRQFFPAMLLLMLLAYRFALPTTPIYASADTVGLIACFLACEKSSLL